MTELSGGQTRALLIADATIICNTPIVLLDEVENAGIHRTRALELLRAVPEDLHFRHARPAHRPALRLPHRDAGRRDRARCSTPTRASAQLARRVSRLDDALAALREQHPPGERIDGSRDLEGVA